ncbi:hypothetical protein [Nonomuraea dietziae]
MHDPPKIPAKWRLEKEGVNLRVITGTMLLPGRRVPELPAGRP